MSEPDFDFIVIGGGSAGYAGATQAAKLGLKTAVIEGGREVGGLCILRGCMPSKTLIESGLRAEAIRGAGEFGLRAEYFGADGAAIRARKRRLIGEFADYRRQQLETGPFEFIRGEAAFADPHTVVVRLLTGGERRLTARTFLIATGSRVQWKCEIPGLRETGCWTSDEVLDAAHIPASVVVLGGGAIALELASFYAGIGSRVSVIQRSAQVLKEVDEDVATALTEALEHRGIEVFRGTKLLRAERDGETKRVYFTHRGADRFAEGEEIIYALGREPAVEKLELDRAGVKFDHTIVADARQRCGADHIFAAGDVCGPVEVVHIAVQQAEIAARNAARFLQKLGGPAEEFDCRLALFAVFTHPPVAVVGLTERQAREKKRDAIIASYPFADHGKAMVRGETAGFVKLIADRSTKEIIGASCIGPDAAEIIHEIVVAMHFRATAGDLMRIPHYHPTLSEIWTYPAEELAAR